MNIAHQLDGRLNLQQRRFIPEYLLSLLNKPSDTRLRKAYNIMVILLKNPNLLKSRGQSLNDQLQGKVFLNLIPRDLPIGRILLKGVKQFYFFIHLEVAPLNAV